jgi:F0F1-type ATP synthase assembly protein I
MGVILVGSGVGYIIDRNTGAGFDYPATTMIVMRKLGEVVAAPVAASSGADGGNGAAAK